MFMDNLSLTHNFSREQNKVNGGTLPRPSKRPEQIAGVGADSQTRNMITACPLKPPVVGYTAHHVTAEVGGRLEVCNIPREGVWCAKCVSCRLRS
jgi:hypothetical protein